MTYNNPNQNSEYEINYCINIINLPEHKLFNDGCFQMNYNMSTISTVLCLHTILPLIHLLRYKQPINSQSGVSTVCYMKKKYGKKLKVSSYQKINACLSSLAVLYSWRVLTHSSLKVSQHILHLQEDIFTLVIDMSRVERHRTLIHVYTLMNKGLYEKLQKL